MPPLDSPDPDDNLQGHSKYRPGTLTVAEQNSDPTINRNIGERESYARPHISAERAQESQPVEQGGGGKGDVQYADDGVSDKAEAQVSE